MPLDGKLDLTYRCNNACLHCWLRMPSEPHVKQKELSLEEIWSIVDQARSMGCQAWSISGGEPMLRQDFPEIFDYITYKSVFYKLNTNGTMITTKIAQLLKRRGQTMVALYGATAEVHDQVTQNPGSWEAMMRGFTYLKEAGVSFTVQIIPLRTNFHQYQAMISLAQSLSNNIRIGAPWLWLSACNSETHNQQIKVQRLDPKNVLLFDVPNPVSDLNQVARNHNLTTTVEGKYDNSLVDDQLFASCIASRRDFHIDPYGGMSFCYYIKDPALRYNLRNGTFQEAWDAFIPSLAEAVRGGLEYQKNCGSCELRSDCRWCAVYGYLEHGRFSAKVDYLCQVAKETRRFKEDWKLTHLRYYQIAGITIQVSADFPITDDTFTDKIENFRMDKPGDDTITIRLVSGVPELSDLRLGKKVYHNPPWAIYKQGDAWVYVSIGANEINHDPYTLAIVNHDHSQMAIYCHEKILKIKELSALTTFNSDQILFAHALAKRQSCYVHSSGIIINGQGLLFVGHSEAGKSTMLKILKGHGEILCDDRNIVRRWPAGFRIHGTWSHGELPDVSPASAPLRAILYLEQAKTNELIPIEDKREQLGKFLSHVVKALVTEDWWDKTLDLAGKVATEVPAYRLKFDKSGNVIDVLRQLYE